MCAVHGSEKPLGEKKLPDEELVILIKNEKKKVGLKWLVIMGLNKLTDFIGQYKGYWKYNNMDLKCGNSPSPTPPKDKKVETQVIIGKLFSLFIETTHFMFPTANVYF